MSMRGDSKTRHTVAAFASTADDSSYDVRSLPVAAVFAGARGIAPRAHDDSELRVLYSGDSDVSDSGKASEAARSPVVPRP